MPSYIDYENTGTTFRPHRHTNHIQAFHKACQDIEDRASHHQLKKDLIEYRWHLAGRLCLNFFRIHLFYLDDLFDQKIIAFGLYLD